MLALVRQEEEEEPVVEFLICDLIRNHAGLVGANGRSPEKGPGWSLCLLREKKHTIGVGHSLCLLLSSRERSERLKFDLSRLFKAFSVQRFFDRDLVLILSKDGGPLTDNVVFIAFSGFRFLSVQQFFGRDPV